MEEPNRQQWLNQSSLHTTIRSSRTKSDFVEEVNPTPAETLSHRVGSTDATMYRIVRASVVVGLFLATASLSSEDVQAAVAQELIPDNQTSQVAPKIVDVRILGNRSVPTSRVLARLKTRQGRYYDADLVQADTREIISMKSFRDVKTYTEEVRGGIIVIFEVVERPVIGELKFIGNRRISNKTLEKQISIKQGDPLDVFSVQLAERTLEDFYRHKGFPNTDVELIKGTEVEDREVIFLIHEDSQKKVWKTEFIGNTIATDARLRTFVKTKPGIGKHLFLAGKVDEEEIENDVKRITAYYRALGYFNAIVEREMQYDDDGEWLTLRFVIDEGPQYTVSSVSIAGNEKFDSAELADMLELQSGDAFNADKMQRDLALLKDLYGSQGHIFADVKADPLFLEQPGQMDLVYEIAEGDVYRVRHVNVHITGDYGVTKRAVVLNRLSLNPGDVIDIREIRRSERLLRASGLFTGDPGTGMPPRVDVKPIDAIESEKLSRQLMAARGPEEFRGQSPSHSVRWVDLDLFYR